MSKVLSEKLKSYIMNLAYKSLPFGSAVWNSSAQKLENLGVRTTYILSPDTAKTLISILEKKQKV